MILPINDEAGLMEEIRGHIVDVFAEKIFPGKLTIAEGIIKEVAEMSNAPDQYIIPGFIDAHIHIESSMVTPSAFAHIAVRHGTVATVSDPHEIANVMGMAGIRYMIDSGKKTPFKFYFGAPSCVPATAFETSGAKLGSDAVAEILEWPEIRYLSEMMNYPGVLASDEEVLAKIRFAKQMDKAIDGHAPGLRGAALVRYIEAGIQTDHECFTRAEALEKLNLGMKVIIREGSAAKNFDALWMLIDEFPESVMLCSDDKHPDDLVKGHIDSLVRKAIENGAGLYNILRAACVNPVIHYGLDVGLIRKGDPADFCIVNNLTEFQVLQTYINGKRVAEKGQSLFAFIPDSPVNHFEMNVIEALDLKIADQQKKVKVITVKDGQLVTGKASFQLPAEHGFHSSDTDNDILKIVMLNRYESAKPAVGFVQGFGLKKGAIASSVAHDCHNIIAVGTNDEDILAAIRKIQESKGGVAAATGMDIRLLPLPVAGIMSASDAYTVAKMYEELDFFAKSELGSILESPFMTLSFCGLLVIPSLKISDLGLFDGDTFELTDLYAED